MGCTSVNRPCQMTINIKTIFNIFTACNEVQARLCFYTCLWFCSGRGGSLSQHAPQVTWPGVSVQEVSILGGGGISVQGGLCLVGLCMGVYVQEGVSVWGSLSRGVPVQGGLCPVVSVQGGLCQGDLPRPVMCRWYASYWNAFLFLFYLSQQKQNGFISIQLINIRVFWLIIRFKCCL